jgi:hypothetical protein
VAQNYHEPQWHRIVGVHWKADIYVEASFDLRASDTGSGPGSVTAEIAYFQFGDIVDDVLTSGPVLVSATASAAGHTPSPLVILTTRCPFGGIIFGYKLLGGDGGTVAGGITIKGGGKQMQVDWDSAGVGRRLPDYTALVGGFVHGDPPPPILFAGVVGGSIDPPRPVLGHAFAFS